MTRVVLGAMVADAALVDAMRGLAPREDWMKRDTVYYVLPMGEVWLLRAIGSAAESYPSLEQALAAAERLTAGGAHVRVLSGKIAPPQRTHAPTEVQPTG
jgi:hypothetical protein